MEELYYLQDKRSYVGNDILWWAKDGRGYTTNLNNAHIYTKDEAVKQNQSRGTDIPWPKTYVDAHTRPAVDMQCVDIQVALQNTGVLLSEPPKPMHEQYKCTHCGRFVSDEEYYTRIDAGYPCHNCEDD